MRIAWRALAIAAAGVVAIGLIGCGSGADDQAQGKPKKPPLVQAVAAEKARLAEYLETTGEVVATNAVTIQATVEGPIAFCPWREGDRVEVAPGEPTRLIEISREMYRAEASAAEATCLAFAVRVHAGEVPVTRCRPVFEGEYGHLKDALVEICQGIGVAE